MSVVDYFQYGLFDVPTDMSFDDDMGGDDDLEAELLALTSGKGASPRKKPKPKPIPGEQLDKLVADSLKDIGSDEELSGDDDDPDLLNELSELTTEEVEVETELTKPEPPREVGIGQLLATRLDMYEKAEANAKKSGKNRGKHTFINYLTLKKTNEKIVYFIFIIS